MYTVAQVTAGLDETAEVKKPSRFKFALQFMRWGTPVILLSFLGYQLTKIGWTEIWHSKPTAWAFYVLLLLPFFVQPVADLLIYRNLWKVGKALQLSVFLRKRYLNAMVMDYSGEAYFYFWAQQTLNVQKNALLHAIKDSNILSAGAGLAMVWIMLLLLSLTGGIRLPALFSDHLVASVAIASLPLILCLVLVIGGKKVTTLNRGQIISTFTIHMVRSILGLGLQFGLWWFSGALPSMTACLYFVALRLLISRLPLLPNKDLLFVGTGIAAANYMTLSTESVAAVLVIMIAFDEILGFALVGVPWLLSRFGFFRKSDASAKA